jgi:hypothetical protein
MIMFEKFQYQQRTAPSLVVNDVFDNQRNMIANMRPDIEADTNIQSGTINVIVK